MRYRVYEQHGNSLSTVLETDSLEQARARYATCYGSQRGAGGIWDTQKEGSYKWL